MLSVTLLDRYDKSGRPLWQLNDSYSYEIGVDTTIVVPAGYITNFGTIPRLAYWIITPAEMREASVLHDFLCNEDFTLNGSPRYSGFSRHVADVILYRHLRKLGIGYFRATAVYVAVRAWAYYSGQRT